jgi:hypothetical protein
MTVFGAALVWPRTGFVAVARPLAITGFFGGFFYVPLAAIMQHRRRRARRGACSERQPALVRGRARGGGRLLGPHGPRCRCRRARSSWPPRWRRSPGTAYVVWLLPDALLRPAPVDAHAHRLPDPRARAREHPERGGALFVSTTFRSPTALLLIGSTDRFIRFLAFRGHSELPYVRPIARMIRVIPISSGQRRREMVKSLREASDAIRAGEIVAIFPGGTDHAHGDDAAVPARLRADHEGRRGADRPREPRRRLGEPLQLREGTLPVEDPAADPVPRDRELRRAPAARCIAARGAAGRAGARQRRMGRARAAT